MLLSQAQKESFRRTIENTFDFCGNTWNAMKEWAHDNGIDFESNKLELDQLRFNTVMAIKNGE